MSAETAVKGDAPPGQGLSSAGQGELLDGKFNRSNGTPQPHLLLGRLHLRRHLEVETKNRVCAQVLPLLPPDRQSI